MRVEHRGCIAADAWSTGRGARAAVEIRGANLQLRQRQNRRPESRRNDIDRLRWASRIREEVRRHADIEGLGKAQAPPPVGAAVQRVEMPPDADRTSLIERL